MYGNEFKTKGNKITPRIKLNHNIHKGEGVRMYEIYFFIHVYTII